MPTPLFLMALLCILAACTQQQAQQDANAVAAQAKDDARYVAKETKENAQLAGNNVERSATRMANNVRDGVKRTNRRLRDWWLTPLPPEPEPLPVQASYCYRVLQDVLCYRDPMPGWEHRLVAYQGTGALPPAPAITRPLPRLAERPAPSAAERLAGSMPVFVNLPPEEKKEAAAPEALSADPAHENLPNPMLSPQL
jgi:hypothetical protein